WSSDVCSSDLAIILVVWFQNMTPVIYFVLILFILMIGNICSQLTVLDQNVQKESTHKFVLYISMTMAFGILWVIFLFKIEFLFRFLSAIFINSILWTMETLAKGVAYFFPEIHGGF